MTQIDTNIELTINTTNKTYNFPIKMLIGTGTYIFKSIKKNIQ